MELGSSHNLQNLLLMSLVFSHFSVSQASNRSRKGTIYTLMPKNGRKKKKPYLINFIDMNNFTNKCLIYPLQLHVVKLLETDIYDLSFKSKL